LPLIEVALGILAALFMLIPLVLAVRIDMQIRAFQAQAFGHLRKAARNLRIMAWSIFGYYVGVLGGSYFVGDLRHMFDWPMPAEGVQIYVRIGAAVLGYLFAGAVARHLYLVTVPEPRRVPMSDED
jgi:MFS family permease